MFVTCLRRERDNREGQAGSPDVWKDTFVIQSDHRIPDDVPFGLGVGHEAERVGDVSQVFLRRRGGRLKRTSRSDLRSSATSSGFPPQAAYFSLGILKS